MSGEQKNDKHSTYRQPLVTRYASQEMVANWSPRQKIHNWRRLWIALARAERELGLEEITESQIACMEEQIDNIDFDFAAKKEKELRHDVMAHIHTYGEACPDAAPIIHLGATSCYVTDNGDLLQIKSSLEMVRSKLVKLISVLKDMSVTYRALPTLGFTHFQPAQLTTVGKRATLWLQDFLLDYQDLEQVLESLPCRGVKGTTGTQASFLSLFDGDHEKVKALNQRVTELLGFSKAIPVSGQTYTRKIDYKVLTIMSGIAQSCHKMATDVRLLASMKEIEEPFGKSQVGSSAMAYKRNPMRSERVCSLARYVMSLPINCAHTHATQWFERTLDDSANRRMTIPEAFMGVDAILEISANIVDGIQVWPFVIRKHIDAELPFMATEVILMECVKAGGNRQTLHEAIREHSMESGKRVKQEGADNDLIGRIRNDPQFKAVHDQLDSLTDPIKFVGRAPEQVDEFIRDEVDPVLRNNEDILANLKIKELNV